jgi:hypothetical protein
MLVSNGGGSLGFQEEEEEEEKEEEEKEEAHGEREEGKKTGRGVCLARGHRGWFRSLAASRYTFV